MPHENDSTFEEALFTEMSVDGENETLDASKSAARASTRDMNDHVRKTRSPASALRCFCGEF